MNEGTLGTEVYQFAELEDAPLLQLKLKGIFLKK